MRRPKFGDIALVLVFTFGLPLSMGGWWRYLSGYHHPQPAAVSAPSHEISRTAAGAGQASLRTTQDEVKIQP
jgi:hypothetical protein